MRISRVAIFATITCLSIKLGITQTLTSQSIANIVDGACWIAIARQTFGSIKSIGATFTEVTSKVPFARTYSVRRLTIITVCSVQITIAWTTIGIAIVSIGTRVAIWFQEFFTTLTTSSFFIAVSGGEEIVTVAS